MNFQAFASRMDSNVGFVPRRKRDAVTHLPELADAPKDCGLQDSHPLASSQLGLMAPEQFIQLAERTRLIIPIGEWALRSACCEAQSWSIKLSVAVQVSAIQLEEPKGFRQLVKTALSVSGLDPARLELEITQSMLTGGSQAALDMLCELRAFGVRIAMGDFGTGCLSLTQLCRFPFDNLEIGPGLLRSLGSNNEAIDVISAIAALAKWLGMRTIVEAIEANETSPHNDLLRDCLETRSDGIPMCLWV